MSTCETCHGSGIIRRVTDQGAFRFSSYDKCHCQPVREPMTDEEMARINAMSPEELEAEIARLMAEEDGA